MPRKRASVTRDESDDKVLNDDGSVEYDADVSSATEAHGDTLEGFGNLRELVFLGRLEKVVPIGKYRFRVSTLNGKQQMSIISKTMLFDETERMSRMRAATLAESIMDVNGVSLEALYDGDKNLDKITKKMLVVEGWQTAMLDKLFLEYSDLSKSSRDALEGNDLKK